MTSRPQHCVVKVKVRRGHGHSKIVITVIMILDFVSSGNEVALIKGGQNFVQQCNGFGMLQNSKEEQIETYNNVAPNQSQQMYTSVSQSEPCSVAGLPNQPFLPSNQSGELLSPFPLQPFTLIPPMVVPYTSLLPGSAQYSIMPSDGYMMPRIVDFSPNRNQMHHLVGQPLTIPGFTVCEGTKSELVPGQKEPYMINLQDVVPDSTHDVTLKTGDTPEASVSNKLNNSEKLPGIQKFLECLYRGSNEDAKNNEKETAALAQRFV